MDILLSGSADGLIFRRLSDTSGESCSGVIDCEPKMRERLTQGGATGREDRLHDLHLFQKLGRLFWEARILFRPG